MKNNSMYHSNHTYVTPSCKVVDLIDENPALLLLLEHLNLDFLVGDFTVEQLCEKSNIDMAFFICVANLYNGFQPTPEEVNQITDVRLVIRCLRRTHRFYKEEKYPSIKADIEELSNVAGSSSVKHINTFFDDYFNEVLEHLVYEEEVAFPYFMSLISKTKKATNFTVTHYGNHHSDIETKLADLKHLLLKHIHIDGHLPLRRRFLSHLFELEFDLNIHSFIEETILLPLIGNIEKQ